MLHARGNGKSIYGLGFVEAEEMNREIVDMLRENSQYAQKPGGIKVWETTANDWNGGRRMQILYRSADEQYDRTPGKG